MATAIRAVKSEMRKRLRAALRAMTAEQRKTESFSIVQQVTGEIVAAEIAMPCSRWSRFLSAA